MALISSDARPPRNRIAALAQAGIVSVAFALLLAGTNAINPLLPVYREQLHLEPLVLSLTFVCYVTILVVTLVALARPSFARHAAKLLIASLLVAVAGDVLLSISTEWSVLAGRIVAGLSGGLATGAAAALVVAAIGARGRALSATGNLVGAVVGTAASQLLVESRGTEAPREVFLWHAATLILVLVAAVIVLRMRRSANDVALTTSPDISGCLRLQRTQMRFFATGCVAWVGVSIAVVFSATMFAELDSPLVRAVGPALMLGSSAAGQLASPAVARAVPWMSGTLLLAIGALGIAGGAMFDTTTLTLLAFATLGIGVGVSYRAGLVALTRGSSPAQQGALSSAYSATSYAGAAVVVLIVGAVGNVVGVAPAAAGALAIVALASLMLLPFSPRLRETVDGSAASLGRR